jgi:hypothetical protein
MATLRPEMFSIEELLDFYEAAEGNDYMIYMGTKPTADYCRYSFVGDKEIGRQKLLTDLTQLRNNPENYNTYLMQVISENGTGRGRAKKEPVLTSIIFQLNRPVQFSGYQQQMGSVGSARTEMLLERLVEQNSLLQSRLAALEAIGELEEEEEEVPESPINAMLNNPDLQQAIVTGIMGLVGGMFAKGGQPTAIAGIDDEAEATEILRSLMSKGVTIDHLRKLNEMSSTKLSSLLFML